MTESTAPVRELNSKTEEEEVSPINETIVAMLMAVAKERGRFYHPILRDSRNAKILDGHQRLEAYKRLAEQGIEVSLTWQDETPKDDDDAKKIMIEVNHYRRPWDEIEDRRTQVQMLRGLRIPGGRGPGGVPSNTQIAEALGVDEKTIRRDLAAAGETSAKAAISPESSGSPEGEVKPQNRPGADWSIEQIREKALRCGIKEAGGRKRTSARKADLLDALEGLIAEGELPPEPPPKPKEKPASRPPHSGNGHKPEEKPAEVKQPVEAKQEEPPKPPKRPEKYETERPRLDRLAEVFRQLEEIHKELDKLCATRPRDGKGTLAHGPEWHQNVVAYVEQYELDSVKELPDHCKSKDRPIVFWMAKELERLGRITGAKVHSALSNHGYLGICGKEPEHLRFDWTKPKEPVAAPLERGAES